MDRGVVHRWLRQVLEPVRLVLTQYAARERIDAVLARLPGAPAGEQH